MCLANIKEKMKRKYAYSGVTCIKSIQNVCQNEEEIVIWQICQQVAHQGARGEPVQAIGSDLP